MGGFKPAKRTTAKGVFDTLGNTFDLVYFDWLPQTGYNRAEADEFEVYDERFLGPEDETSEVDIYIPVEKKD